MPVKDAAYHEFPAIKRVAVIGAGAAGMPMARHLRDSGIEVVVYERASGPGGIWRYRDSKAATPPFPSLHPSQTDVRPDLPHPHATEQVTQTWRFEGSSAQTEAESLQLEFAPPGPAYATLKNNIPAPLMAFMDKPRPMDGPWYFPHGDHLAYLEAYAEDFDIHSMVRYNTRVEKIDRVYADGLQQTWKVWSKSLTFDRSEHESVTATATWDVETFDAVVCATGHHNAPATPDVPGLKDWAELWPDRVSHALSFRRGEDWKDHKRVLVVGSGPSGSDMAREIAPYVEHVYVTSRPFENDDAEDTKVVKMSFRERLVSDRCSLVSTVNQFLPPTTKDGMGSIELTDGAILEVDSVLFATGYYHSYPFLSDFESRASVSEDTKIVHGQYTVLNLHDDLFYIPDPTLILLGVPANISAFSFFEYQSIVVTRVWTGQAQLPSRLEMQMAYKARRAAVSDRNIHVYGKDTEVQKVAAIAAWLNAEATRLRLGEDVRKLDGYSAEYLAVKKRTSEGLKLRDQEEDVRLAEVAKSLLVPA